MVKRMAISKQNKELIDILFSIWDNKNFVLGVVCNLETDEEAQSMIDFIRSNDGLSTDDILLKSLFINRDRGKR